MDFTDGRIMIGVCICLSIVLCLFSHILYRCWRKKIWIRFIPIIVTVIGMVTGFLLIFCQAFDQMIALGIMMYSFCSFVITGTITVLIISYWIRYK